MDKLPHEIIDSAIAEQIEFAKTLIKKERKDMRLSRYVLTKSTILIIENVDSRDSAPLSFEAIKGTTFLGKWIPSKATKGMGDLALEGGYCIPLCPKSLFRKE